MKVLASMVPCRMSCRRAVLTHFCYQERRGTCRTFKNWRPVSLLCVDYKLLSKALANRLRGKLWSKVIHQDQTYCVPGRSMVDNVYLIRDVLEVSSSLGIDTGLISLDQEKAFDRVEHNFLWKVHGEFWVQRRDALCTLSGTPVDTKYASSIQGLLLPGFSKKGIVLSAYADDVIVFIQRPRKMQTSLATETVSKVSPLHRQQG
ncbi:hypothetical protein L3Q82_019081 [Scortum barcoo]|uniref:Uncharacterized protein n=1 Tax=Scortum barcoo TaxID=214431 RepID=A0ACB8VGI7_9TELE|nr:hypothetical protein L3Q82_019081 [Scortum barcoo]